jgi:hypothetical protein
MSQIRELTGVELDQVSGGEVGLYTTSNSVGFTLPGLLHIGISTDGDKVYFTGTVGNNHGGSLEGTPPGGRPA